MCPTNNPPAFIEPDIQVDEDDFQDSGAGSDSESLVSIASSIANHIYKNGRRYSGHRGVKYYLPNDEAECDRHDLLHHIYNMLFGGQLFFAPICNKPEKILDIGTGTGIWAIDIADQYPDAQVIGTDVSPIQPSWVPPNLQFQIDNAEESWTFQKNHFDYIHLRNMNGSIQDWPQLLKQIYEHLKPGAWIECQEPDVVAQSDDHSIPSDSCLRKWEIEFLNATAKIGLPVTAVRTMKEMLIAAGFVDVQERLFKLPFNPWPKDPELKQLGRFQLAQYLDALPTFGPALLVEIQGWTHDEMEVFLARLRKDLKNKSFHGYNLIHVITGQKPLGEV